LIVLAAGIALTTLAVVTRPALAGPELEIAGGEVADRRIVRNEEREALRRQHPPVGLRRRDNSLVEESSTPPTEPQEQ